MNENNKIAKLLFPKSKPIKFWQKKFKKSKQKAGALVTRFAPSPTGFIHFGNFIQMVIDIHLAKSTGGRSILRLEDTDKTREVSGAINEIYNTAEQYGLKFDEGFLNFKNVGKYAPYRQSDRKEIYASFARHLVEQGFAYPCFCGAKEDDEPQSDDDEGVENKFVGYLGANRKCHKLNLAEIEENLKQKKPFAIRFRAQAKSKDERITGNDVLRGELEFQRWQQDDVLLKSDGLPVYHFAHIVDDHLMGVNLVVRGVDWVSTYPLHLDILRAFGFNMNYMHTMLVCMEENGSRIKFSKRKHPQFFMSYYSEAGYPAAAVLEYVYTLNFSDFEDWRAKNLNSPLGEFKINFAKTGTSMALFDEIKLKDISKNIIGRMTAEQVFDQALEWANKYDESFALMLKENKDKWIKIFSIERGGERPRRDIALFSEIKNDAAYFFERPKTEFNNSEKQLLTDFAEIFKQGMPRDEWWEQIKKAAEKNNYATDNKAFKTSPEKFAGNLTAATQVLRVALTGREKSPEMFLICEVLGEEETRQRILAATN